jgi:hypothetical protein
MDEIEVPTEAVQEEIRRRAEESREQWITRVALSTAILAVFAAVTALLAGHFANEAMIERIESSDLWAHYQSKSVKRAIHSTKDEILMALGKSGSGLEKVEQYKKEQADIAAHAQKKELASETHLRRHIVLARGVTMFQIGIAVAAVAILVRRKSFWFLGLGFGVIGLGYLAQGLIAG